MEEGGTVTGPVMYDQKTDRWLEVSVGILFLAGAALGGYFGGKSLWAFLNGSRAEPASPLAWGIGLGCSALLLHAGLRLVPGRNRDRDLRRHPALSPVAGRDRGRDRDRGCDNASEAACRIAGPPGLPIYEKRERFVTKEVRMQTRPIPSTNEPLPVIGCGTWQTFDVGASARERAPLAEVLRELSPPSSLEITTCLRRGELEIATVFEPAAMADYDLLEAALLDRFGGRVRFSARAARGSTPRRRLSAMRDHSFSARSCVWMRGFDSGVNGSWCSARKACMHSTSCSTTSSARVLSARESSLSASDEGETS